VRSDQVTDINPRIIKKLTGEIHACDARATLAEQRKDS
jgi:hypothetical protein